MIKRGAILCMWELVRVSEREREGGRWIISADTIQLYFHAIHIVKHLWMESALLLLLCIYLVDYGTRSAYNTSLTTFRHLITNDESCYFYQLGNNNKCLSLALWLAIIVIEVAEHFSSFVHAHSDLHRIIFFVLLCRFRQMTKWNFHAWGEISKVHSQELN
jgi:hypothetical protein